MDGLRLDGRVAVVTGGAGAIGAAVCRDLAALGARVVVADVDEDGAVAVADEINGTSKGPAGPPRPPRPPGPSVPPGPPHPSRPPEPPVPPGPSVPPGPRSGSRTGPRAPAVALCVDLADPGSVERVPDRTGPVDILVNNAGISIVEPFATSDPAGWELMWRVNLRGPMLLTRLLLPGMTERGWGRLVFVSSDGARAGSGGEGAYAATKAGLFGLAKSLAREAARGGVTSNVVCPGPTDTPMLRRVDAERPGLVGRIVRDVPLRRLGTPEDVAGLVAYLCTDRAAYVTGQTLSVSGGVTMH
ncbi:2-hydroxycyclohexanecarboxyl-CoA dehydrogenase [Streptosporangium becharense]|uniref:2-hydroxycyclohexanecarboxyl-CoA dehydrogenase n=1 Tax=Streptosporangium becharense TaxID=1816182 RepID=A0A7W9MG09_9ACTN|nr:SDR family NAD(P)-dependent oxidoreductase [Streptosporangium becharense]MBB2912331.1 2-hydroxycyclohexanecarboxyl-CoA dehydrogenase [Streptosporangium becharense]MBB5818878.1 2-hydroxycyclohexanecarboxyl-CoA dehydrogenase [Streptosporangium becharense]